MSEATYKANRDKLFMLKVFNTAEYVVCDFLNKVLGKEQFKLADIGREIFLLRKDQALFQLQLCTADAPDEDFKSPLFDIKFGSVQDITDTLEFLNHAINTVYPCVLKKLDDKADYNKVKDCMFVYGSNSGSWTPTFISKEKRMFKVSTDTYNALAAKSNAGTATVAESKKMGELVEDIKKMNQHLTTSEYLARETLMASTYRSFPYICMEVTTGDVASLEKMTAGLVKAKGESIFDDVVGGFE